MPPIIQSIDQYYREYGFDSQAKFYQSQIPENFTIPNFDEYKLSLRQPQVQPFEDTYFGITEIDKDIQTGITHIDKPIEDVFIEKTIRKTEPALGQDVPEPRDEEIFEPSKKDLDFALYAKESYEPIDKRKDINNYKYIESDSTELLATYYNPNNKNLIQAVRGTRDWKDMKRNIGIGLGAVYSFRGADALEPDYTRLKFKIKDNEKKYDPKKITIVGHSSGGSFSNYIGVDNPHYDIITYNMGQGLPFLTDYVKCKLGGCKNIKNYRVIGDWASSLSDYFSSGKTFNLRPIKPTRELELEAESKDSILIPSELYIPHSIDQFINRGGGSQFHPDPYVYGRKLSRKVGAVFTAVGVPLALGITKNLIDTKIQQAYREGLPQYVVGNTIYEENMDFIENLAETMGYDRYDEDALPSTLINVLHDKVKFDVKAGVDIGNLKYIEKGVNMLGGGGNILTAGLGYGLGDIAGLAIYENLLKDNHFENI